MSHISVLLHETIDALLADRHTGIYVDATFGRGGHSRLLLSKLDANSRVYAFDKDPQALAVAAELEQQDSRFKIIHASFADVQQELTALGLDTVDGIMADLGVSSPQLDQAERGFSFMQDGPLDMRMDNSQGQTASEWLMQIEEEALANIIFQYGEERYSRRIARAIKQAGEITTTARLAEIVKTAHPKWEKNKHPATRTFQAIRIAINKELDDIEIFLPQAVNMLSAHGRLAVISFHSLEDRLIKQLFKEASTIDVPKGLPFIPDNLKAPLELVNRKPILPSQEELEANNRAHSAKLRVAKKVHK